jgi:hypothetical protein
VLFLGSLQMVSEPPSNVRSCGTGALHDGDVRGKVCNTLVPYWKKMNSSDRVSGL